MGINSSSIRKRATPLRHGTEAVLLIVAGTAVHCIVCHKSDPDKQELGCISCSVHCRYYSLWRLVLREHFARNLCCAKNMIRIFRFEKKTVLLYDTVYEYLAKVRKHCDTVG